MTNNAGLRGCNSAHFGYYVLSISFRYRESGLATELQAAFFSYSRDDSKFALRLAADLKAAGASVWLDQLDLVGGQRWTEAVQEALEKCPRVLAILSPSAVASPNVMDEVIFALDERKTVIPVLYRDCKVLYRLRSLHLIDFRTDYARGLGALLRALGVEPQQPIAPVVPEMPKEGETVVSDVVDLQRLPDQKHLDEERRLAAEQTRLERERQKAAKQAWLGEHGKEEEARALLENQLKRAEEQARLRAPLEEDRKLTVEQARLEEERKQGAPEQERPKPGLGLGFFSKVHRWTKVAVAACVVLMCAAHRHSFTSQLTGFAVTARI